MTGLVPPAALARQGYALRNETPEDEAFLERLYLSVRWEELAPAPWPDEEKRRFLRWQFSLQRKHYTTYYAGGDFGIVTCGDTPAGRLYLFRGASDLRIVDISLLPEHRGRGAGTLLLQTVFADAAPTGRSVSIHVEHFNPARRLYDRLGFREVSRDGVYALMEWRAMAEAMS